jgi:hypothetical protein
MIKMNHHIFVLFVFYCAIVWNSRAETFPGEMILAEVPRPLPEIHSVALGWQLEPVLREFVCGCCIGAEEVQVTSLEE